VLQLSVVAVEREAHAPPRRASAPSYASATTDLVNYTPGTYESALKDGGRVASSTGAAGEGAGRTNVMASPMRENLERVGALLADGSLRISVQRTYDFAQAPEALAHWRPSTPRASWPSTSPDELGVISLSDLTAARAQRVR